MYCLFATATPKMKAKKVEEDTSALHSTGRIISLTRAARSKLALVRELQEWGGGGSEVVIQKPVWMIEPTKIKEI